MSLALIGRFEFFQYEEKNIFCVEERTTLCGVNMDHCPRQPLLRTYFRSYHIIVDHIYRDCEFFFNALFSFSVTLILPFIECVLFYRVCFSSAKTIKRCPCYHQ